MTIYRRRILALLALVPIFINAACGDSEPDPSSQYLVYKEVNYDANVGRIVRVDAEGANRQVLFQGPADFYSPLFVAPDNRILFLFTNGWQLLPAAGGTPTPFTTPAAYNVNEKPVWAPDGASIAWIVSPLENPYTRQIAIAATGSATYQVITPDSLEVLASNWSPDGSHLVFSALDINRGAYRLFTVSRTGTEVRRLTPDSIQDAVLASWSPDGDRIAFLYGDIWTVAPDGSDIDRVTEGGAGIPPAGFTSGPWWSPDGRNIASSIASTNRMFRVNVASGTVTDLTRAAPPFSPISPDGSTLLYITAFDHGNGEIWGTVGVAKANGTDGIMVSGDTVRTADPAWLSEP